MSVEVRGSRFGEHLNGSARSLLTYGFNILLREPSKQALMLGDSIYYVKRGPDSLWMVVRPNDSNSQEELNLWVCVPEANGHKVIPEVEFHSYDRGGRLVKEYHAGNNSSLIALAEGRKMLTNMQKDLASRESSKRA